MNGFMVWPAGTPGMLGWTLRRETISRRFFYDGYPRVFTKQANEDKARRNWTRKRNLQGVNEYLTRNRSSFGPSCGRSELKFGEVNFNAALSSAALW